MTQPVSRQIAPPTASPRLFYVDNLRTALMALVVIHHSVMGYSNVSGWYYVEPPADSSAMLLDILIVLDQAFFMGAFFLVSALFVPGSYDRKGAGRFLRERLLRLGVPLVLWLLVIRPLATVSRYAAASQGTELPYWQYYVQSFIPGPMWFVEVLLVFSALYALWRLMSGKDRRVSDQAPGTVAIIGFTLGLALVTYLWRIVVPMGVSLLGLPSPAYLPQYAALFVVGLLAARRGWLGGLSRPAGRAGFATAAVAAIGLLLALLSAPEAGLGRGTLSSLMVAACETALAVGVIIGLLVLFRERFGHQGPRHRFLSDHAFTVYVVHPAVLVALGYALSGVQAPAAAKAALLATLALPLCWGVAYLVRALPGARKVL